MLEAMGWFPGAAVSASSPLKALRLEAGGSLSALPAVDGFFLFLNMGWMGAWLILIFSSSAFSMVML